MNSAENKEHLQALIGSDYELQWIIGHGGMSTVWLADDTRNDREVALKVLRPEFSDNQEFLSRFRNEAKSAESIQSENVVATYDYRELEDNGRKFCFMALGMCAVNPSQTFWRAKIRCKKSSLSTSSSRRRMASPSFTAWSWSTAILSPATSSLRKMARSRSRTLALPRRLRPCR